MRKMLGKLFLWMEDRNFEKAMEMEKDDGLKVRNRGLSKEEVEALYVHCNEYVESQHRKLDAYYYWSEFYIQLFIMKVKRLLRR
jgi:hypothetical protein